MSLACASIVATVICLAVPSTASAKTFEPTRKDDPFPNGCRPNNCSLREATIAANERPGSDTILLRGGDPYVVERPRTATTPLDGDFDLRDNPVTIRGRGQFRTIISGNGVDRALYVSSSDSTLRDLQVRDGLAGEGAGLYSYFSDLTLNRVFLEGNEATNKGGGLYHLHGTLTVRRSTIDDNEAANGGGGLYMQPGLVENRARFFASTLSENDTDGLGGAIYLDGFHSNPASFDDKPVAELINSTVADNNADVSGGGIAAIFGSTLDVDNTTIAYNNADLDNSGGGFGGGVFQSSDAIANVTDSIVAKNEAGSTGGGDDCSGNFEFSGTILESFDASCNPNGAYGTTGDALLGLRADNGGRPRPWDSCPAVPRSASRSTARDATSGVSRDRTRTATPDRSSEGGHDRSAAGDLGAADPCRPRRRSPRGGRHFRADPQGRPRPERMQAEQLLAAGGRDCGEPRAERRHDSPRSAQVQAGDTRGCIRRRRDGGRSSCTPPPRSSARNRSHDGGWTGSGRRFQPQRAREPPHPAGNEDHWRQREGREWQPR